MKVMGIDPGMNTGIAILRLGRVSELHTVAPEDIEAMLIEHQPERVVFEDSRKQSNTWTAQGSQAKVAKVARNIGQIDAWCYLIEVICRKLEIPAHGISPAAKGAKLNAEAFRQVTGWAGSSNEHQRDAAMCAWKYHKVRGVPNA